MKIIDIKNLIVEYDNYEESLPKTKVIDDISLDINEGEFVCILGRNGSGKSTFAKCLNGLIIPTSGDVIVDGINTKDYENILEIRKKVGLTFQNPDNQIVASIVEEDIAFGLENLGIEKDEMRNRIDEAMKILEIYDIKDYLTSKLSGGQKQKVAIAGILAMKSKIFVLDEPTSMIDSIGRNEILECIKKINNEENITIIMISHHITDIFYADRVLVLDGGKIVIDDIPNNILLKQDLLEKIGIEAPYIPRLSNELKKKGLNFIGNEREVIDLLKNCK